MNVGNNNHGNTNLTIVILKGIKNNSINTKMNTRNDKMKVIVIIALIVKVIMMIIIIFAVDLLSFG